MYHLISIIKYIIQIFMFLLLFLMLNFILSYLILRQTSILLGISDQLKKFSNLLVFYPFRSAISERVTFLKDIQSLQFKNFPFHCTLKISYPAQIDTWHLSMHPACLARENVADNESRDRNGSGRNTGKTLKEDRTSPGNRAG